MNLTSFFSLDIVLEFMMANSEPYNSTTIDGRIIFYEKGAAALPGFPIIYWAKALG